jgi:hypothetical protein
MNPIATKRLRTLCLTILAVGAVTSVSEAAGLRTALVIGAQSYKHWKPLRTSLNDADEIAAALRTLSYEVITVRDGTITDVRRGLAALRTRLNSPHESVVLFYAGHGVQIAGLNYMVPVDFPADPGGDVLKHLFPLTEILEPLTLLGEDVTKIVLLDACRNNPLVEKLKTAPGLAEPSVAPLNAVIGYATEPNNTAEDGDWKHSPYTKALLRDLGRVGQDIDLTLRNVRNFVVDMTDGDQVPWVATSLPRPFYLRPPVIAKASLGSVDDAAVVMLNGVEVLSSSGRRAAPITLSAGHNELVVAVFNQKTYTGNNPYWGLPEGWHARLALEFAGDAQISSNLKNQPPPCGLDRATLRLESEENRPPRNGARHGGLFVATTASLHVEEYTGHVRVVAANCNAWSK